MGARSRTTAGLRQTPTLSIRGQASTYTALGQALGAGACGLYLPGV